MTSLFSERSGEAGSRRSRRSSSARRGAWRRSEEARSTRCSSARSPGRPPRGSPDSACAESSSRRTSFSGAIRRKGTRRCCRTSSNGTGIRTCFSVRPRWGGTSARASPRRRTASCSATASTCGWRGPSASRDGPSTRGGSISRSCERGSGPTSFRYGRTTFPPRIRRAAKLRSRLIGRTSRGRRSARS